VITTRLAANRHDPVGERGRSGDHEASISPRTNAMPITGLYAGLLTLVFVVLSFRVIKQRRQARVGIGSGDDALLLRRMRVHANFAEYVPLALLLMALLESQRANAVLLHGLGSALVVGRLVHAVGVSQAKENFNLRVTGMILTFSVLITGSLACLVLSGRGVLGLAP
jgi:hypothetical protein